MLQPFHCPVRQELASRLEGLLDTYAQDLLKLARIHGFIEAENLLSGGYEDCVQARHELKRHLREHGCDDQAYVMAR